MKVLSRVSRRSILAAIAALLVAVVWLVSVKPAQVATAAPHTVGDYLVRVARAMGLEARVGPRAPVDEYVALLAQQHVITAEAAQRLQANQRLTREFALELSSRFDPPAPPFLSKSYVHATLLAKHGEGVGLVRDDDEHEEDRHLFEGEHERRHHCPTPSHRHQDDDSPCPRDD